MNDEVKDKVENSDMSVESEAVDNNTAVDNTIFDVASNPNLENNFKSDELINNKEKSGVTICIPIENFDENMTIRDVMSANTNGQSRNILDQVAQSKKVVLQLKVPNKTCTVKDIENFFRNNDFNVISPSAYIPFISSVIDMPFFDGVIIKYSSGDEYAKIHVGLDNLEQKVKNLIAKIELMPLFPDTRTQYQIVSNSNWLNEFNGNFFSEMGNLGIEFNPQKTNTLIYIFGNSNYPNGYFMFSDLPFIITLKKRIDINNFSDLSKLEINEVQTSSHGNGLANLIIDGKVIKSENGIIILSGSIKIKSNNSTASIEKVIYDIENFSLIFTIDNLISPMKVTLPKCLKTEEQVLIINKNENIFYKFNEEGFVFDGKNSKELNDVKINVLNPNGEVYYRDKFKTISVFFKKPTFNQSNGSFFDVFDESNVSIPQSNINTLSDQSMMIELSDKFDSNNPSNLSKVKSITIFDKNVKLENANATLDGFNSVESGNAGLSRGFFGNIVPIDGGDWNYPIPVYNPTLNVKYVKLIGKPVLKFTKINPSLPMKITIPAFGTSKEQTIIVNENENFICTLSEDSFNALDINKIIPKNLLIKMPKEFYTEIKDDPKTFEAVLKNTLKNKIINGNQCTVNFPYKDINNKSQNIEFIFKTKDLGSLSADSWSNEIKSLLFNQSFSRTSLIYLESIKNLNYFVRFDKDGRALYDEKTNILGLAKILDYKNPENELLAETNLIQPFYEYQTSPQTYNFGKKIFWYFNNCPIIIVNKRDKKVILSLNANDRIDIYFNDIEGLTGATKMYLIGVDNVKKEIKFENCNVSINLSMSSSVGGSDDGYIVAEKYYSGGPMSSDSCTWTCTLTEFGKKITNYIAWFDNQGNFSGSQTNSDVCRKKPDYYSPRSGYQYVQYIENASIASIEFDAIDVNKNVTVTLPSYTPSNANFTKINLDHGGFVVSAFNLNTVEFKIKFNSKDLDEENTRINVIDQNDFGNEEFMTRIINERESLSRNAGEEYRYVDVVYYNPDDDLDGEIRDALFEQNSRSVSLLFAVMGLISIVITLSQKISKSLGGKISKELELALNIIQFGLSLGQVATGIASGSLTFSMEKFSEIEKVIKSISTLGSVLSNSISNLTVIIEYLGGTTTNIPKLPLVQITDDTVIRWRDGIKEYLPCTKDVADIIVVHTYTFASHGDITKFRDFIGKDKVEYTTLLCLESILKYGAEYIYKIGNGKISIGEAETLNFIFVQKASLAYLQCLINIYQG